MTRHPAHLSVGLVAIASVALSAVPPAATAGSPPLDTAWSALTSAMTAGRLSVPDAAPVHQDVAQALYDAAPTIAAEIDDSTQTGCMSAPPVQHVVYRRDRIVLRTSLSKRAVRERVNIALGDQGEVTKVAIIKLPQTPPVVLDPIVSVSLIEEPGQEDPINIVELARTLSDPNIEDPIPAAPDYLLSPTSGPSGMWPDGYPEPTTVEETPRDASYGSGVVVWVFDTGLPDEDYGDWAPNVSELRGADDLELLDEVEPHGVVDLYFGGHTLAIADVIHTLAPGTTVKAVQITTEQERVVTDVSAAKRMAKELRATNAWPQVMVAAFGSPVCTAWGADMVPIGLHAVAESIDVRGGSVMVASAGNRSSVRRFYPAAFDTYEPTPRDAVISVGALDTVMGGGGNWFSPSRSGPRAHFSNRGQWVEAWTPGVDLAVRHVKDLQFRNGCDELDDPACALQTGRALVSGTSFAAPYLAALIAEVIPGARNDSPYAAWNEIKATGNPCDNPENGGGMAVALTSMEDTATTPPPGTDGVPPPEC